MEILPLLFYSVIFLSFLFSLKLLRQTRRFRNLPPGPLCLPIIGNLHHLKRPLHHTLQKLSQKYGPIFSLWFGSRFVVVVSSPSAVQECFTSNDIVLANRPRFISGKYIGYNYTTLGSSPYGSHWRNLRRIIMLDVLSSHRLNNFTELRTDEIRRVLQKVAQNSRKGFAKVELSSMFHEMTFNNMMRMISGKRYYGDDCDVTDVEEARHFREMVTELLQLSGANNKADFLPILKWFDFDKLEKRLQGISKRTDAFLEALIDQHRKRKERTNTMIDHLLSLQESEPEYYTDQIIKGLSLGMLLAGTDSSAVTLEWAMTNLLNNPEILKKAKNELDSHIGEDRLLEESDLSKLSYLKNIILETLRLHPPAPLMLPHLSSADCTIGGFSVPRDTIVLVNAWAIQRDPQLWTEATCFKPERFEKEGEASKLIAFGLGRRACPGDDLALRAIGLTLGLLIQCFEWERVGLEEIDMTEKNGLVSAKLIPLEAMCKAHPLINMVK